MNISTFLFKLEDKLNARKAEIGLTYFDHYQVIATERNKFFKVYRQEMKGNKVNHRAIVAFIDKNTGDIFMPASFSAPAKHARGNVNSPTNGMEAIDEQGNVRRLKN